MSSKPKSSDSQVNSPWLSSEQAAEYLGVSAWSVRKYAREDGLRSARTPGVRGSLRFRREWLDEFLERREVTTGDSLPAVRDPQGSFALECPTLAAALRDRS